MKISVIIPVYNVEKYLEECLDSVINQTLKDIEIICINDGSSDSSEEILRKYVEIDNRFVLINQKNQGQSVARNKGIEIAQGDYIYFLDSDDKIVLHALERMYEEVTTYDLDAVYFDGESFFETKELEQKYSYYKTSYVSKLKSDKVVSGVELFYNMRVSDSYRVQSCLYLIRREYVQKQFLFEPGIIHEDVIFMTQTLLGATKVKHIPEQLFLRRVRPNSTITQGVTYKHFYGSFICYLRISDYVKKISLTREEQVIIIQYLEELMVGVEREFILLSNNEKEKLNTMTELEFCFFQSLFLPELKGHLHKSLYCNYKKRVSKKKTIKKRLQNLEECFRSYGIKYTIVRIKQKFRKIFKT